MNTLVNHYNSFLLYVTGITYFFKGKEYWGFNNTWKKTEEGYPRSATSYWLGCKN